ncbi:MFS transporter [Nonomuraea sp. NPDC050328]|uniref:MFS transporter n=1 Tax=Nonomuraea sp. NPDC050328 TaxID=3364361 RepID=UPI0037931503
MRLFLLGLGALITAIDFTIVYVALPQIARDVGFSATGLQWVVTAYAVPFGGLLLLGGRLADLVGRRRMFVAGMILYGVASTLGGLSGSPGWLILARVLQGVGGALLMPATLSLVATLFDEGPARNRAMTVWAVCGAGGLSLGALLGGVLTGYFGWSAVFFVNVPIAAAGALLALTVLPASAPPLPAAASPLPGSAPSLPGDRRFDLPGALLGTLGVTGLILALTQGPVWGWPTSALLAAASLAALGAFLLIESRTRNPLMPLRLWSNPHTRTAALAILVYGMTLQSVPYFLTLYFQDVLGYAALQSGLAFLGPTLGITAGNLLSERLLTRLGLRRTLLISLATGVAGTALLGLSLTPDGTYLTLLAGLLGFGLGSGLSFNTLFILASTGVPATDQGAASGLSTTVLQAGSGTGLALLILISGTDGTPDLRLAVLTAALLAVTALILPLRRKTRKAAAPNL